MGLENTYVCQIRRLWDYRGIFVYSNMVTVPHKIVGLERMSENRSVGLQRSHCTHKHTSTLLYMYPQTHLYTSLHVPTNTPLHFSTCTHKHTSTLLYMYPQTHLYTSLHVPTNTPLHFSTCTYKHTSILPKSVWGHP